MLHRILCVGAMALLLGACSGLSALDGASGDAAPPPGAPAPTTDEIEVIRGQVDKALEEQRFDAAWNQEIVAGADRARLEAIAVSALEARSRHAEAMFAALRAKHGALSSAARGRVEGLVAEARTQQRWTRALAIEILAADDPPTFARGLALYRDAPPDRAPALLEALREAQAEHREEAD